jgi:hypothetical protein
MVGFDEMALMSCRQVADTLGKAISDGAERWSYGAISSSRTERFRC